MARKAKSNHGSNGYDSEKLQALLGEIDRADAQLAKLKSDYMHKCRVPRAEIVGIFEDAKEAGIPVKSFRMVVKNHRLTHKIAANVAKLEDDDADAYERIVQDLGDFIDLPLGKAAAERVRGQREALA